MGERLLLIGNNVSVNKSISSKTGVTVAICASHHYNLAMQDLLVQEEVLIPGVQNWWWNSEFGTERSLTMTDQTST